MNTNKRINLLVWALGAVVLISSIAPNAQAQVPPDIEDALRKIGQIVDPPCTAKLYRPLMPNNISKYKGDPDRMFIWAHSAGNGPLGVYIGHPELHGPKGMGVKGAVFMSGNPVPGLGGPAGGAGGGARGGGPVLAAAGSTC